MSLKVENLSVVLNGGNQVVSQISLQMKKGEMLAIVGSSGAGKSTVCKAIMGLLGENYTVTGKIQYKTKDLLTLHKKEKSKIFGKEISLIMQNPMTALNPSIRVGRQMVSTYLQHHNKESRDEVLKKCEKTLWQLGLADTSRILQSYPYTLSGGMLQRIMIAIALINEPEILIADEATTAIDACNRVELMELLKQLSNKGMSILFITHDLRSARYCNRTMIMHQGRMIEEGETKELFENPHMPYTQELLDACSLERRRYG